MLISEEYRRLNRELHGNVEYGVSGKSYAPAVRRLCELVGTRDVLDYGCGKRTLAQMLLLQDQSFVVNEYDPAIRGLDVLPTRASDVTVCTDVLEHLEPETIETVLAHIAHLTGRVAFFSVSCVPAVKVLADGRNAHISQHEPEWWLEKLERHFRLLRVFGKPDGFVFIGQSHRDQGNIADLSEIGPPPEVKKMQGKSVYSDEKRSDHIRSAMLRGLPTIKVLPAHDKTMVIACYGPSLVDTLGILRDEQRAGGDVWSLSGAHHFLIKNGIVPMAHVEADPQPINVERLGKTRDDVVYFCASACSRQMFNHLHRREVWLFHQTSSETETRLMRQLGGSDVFTVDGGTNTGMTAIALGSALGYRRFSIHGMDCSFKADEEVLRWQPRRPGMDIPKRLLRKIHRHAGKHPNADQFVIRVHVGERVFITSPQMAQGVQDYVGLLGMITPDSQYRFRLHGDGMLKATVEYIRDKERQDAERVRRLRSEAASRSNGSDALDYAARFKAGLLGSARPVSVAYQAPGSH